MDQGLDMVITVNSIAAVKKILLSKKIAHCYKIIGLESIGEDTIVGVTRMGMGGCVMYGHGWVCHVWAWVGAVVHHGWAWVGAPWMGMS